MNTKTSTDPWERFDDAEGRRGEEDDSLAEHLEVALDRTDDETVRYHVREALQLRLAERD